MLKEFFLNRSHRNLKSKTIISNGKFDIFSYSLHRSKKYKNLKIKLISKDNLKITCSLHHTDKFIFDFLQTNLHKFLRYNHETPVTKTTFNDGDLILFQGQQFPLRIKWIDRKHSKLSFLNNSFLAEINLDLSDKQKNSEIANLLNKFYKLQTLNLCQIKLAELQKKYGLEYNKITIKKQQSRWGSCSAQKNLNFNINLSKLPAHLAQYVVCHEYAHLKHLDHSQKFWEFLEKICPQSSIFRQELRLIEKKIH